MLYPLDPPVTEMDLKRFEISFRDQGVDTVSEGEVNIHGEPTANAVSSSHKARLVWALSEYRFLVYARSRDEAIAALKKMSALMVTVSAEDPYRIACVEFDLNYEERSFIRSRNGEAGSIGPGSVLFFGAKIIGVRPLGGKRFKIGCG